MLRSKSSGISCFCHETRHDLLQDAPVLSMKIMHHEDLNVPTENNPPAPLCLMETLIDILVPLILKQMVFI